MVFIESVVPVLDNTGGKLVRIIKGFGKRRESANVGELILVTLKEVYPRKKVKKGTLQKAVLTLGPNWRIRSGGVHMVKNILWGCVLLKKDELTPRATRLRAAVSLDLYQTAQVRVLALAPRII